MPQFVVPVYTRKHTYNSPYITQKIHTYRLRISSRMQESSYVSSGFLRAQYEINNALVRRWAGNGSSPELAPIEPTMQVFPFLFLFFSLTSDSAFALFHIFRLWLLPLALFV